MSKQRSKVPIGEIPPGKIFLFNTFKFRKLKTAEWFIDRWLYHAKQLSGKPKYIDPHKFEKIRIADRYKVTPL